MKTIKLTLKQMILFVFLGIFVFGFKGTAFAEEEKVEAKLEKKEDSSKKTEETRLYSLNYSFTNSMGAGTFVSGNSNPSLFHEFGLGGSYKMNDQDSVSLSLGWDSEAFTQSDGGKTDLLYFRDPKFTFSTKRLPALEINEDWKINFGPKLSLTPGVNQASRKITRRTLATSLGVSASTAFNGFALIWAPSFNYYFNRHTHLTSDLGRSSYDGYLNERYRLTSAYVFSYSYEKLSAGITYAHLHRRTEESNAGNSYWKNLTSFTIESSYAYHKYLSFTLGMTTLQDPYNKKGEFRIPFWAPAQAEYVDYYNTSSIYLSLAGSY